MGGASSTHGRYKSSAAVNHAKDTGVINADLYHINHNIRHLFCVVKS